MLSDGYVVLQRVGAIRRWVEPQKGGPQGTAWLWRVMPLAFEEWPSAAEGYAAERAVQRAKRDRQRGLSRAGRRFRPASEERPRSRPLSGEDGPRIGKESDRNSEEEGPPNVGVTPERFEEGYEERTRPSRSNSKGAQEAHLASGDERENAEANATGYDERPAPPPGDRDPEGETVGAVIEPEIGTFEPPIVPMAVSVAESDSTNAARPFQNCACGHTLAWLHPEGVCLMPACGCEGIDRGVRGAQRADAVRLAERAALAALPNDLRFWASATYGVWL